MCKNGFTLKRKIESIALIDSFFEKSKIKFMSNCAYIKKLVKRKIVVLLYD